MFAEPKFSISEEILKLTAEIDEFKGRWRALKTFSPDVLKQLRRSATIESVGSSTRIEGAKLSDREVAEFLSGLRTDSFKNRDEEEVAGYAEAMNLVFDNWEFIPPTEGHICQLHKVLLGFSKKDERHRGEYKKSANNVVAMQDGRQVGVVFETSTPFETPYEMEKLMKWVDSEVREDRVHPLLIVAVFVVTFLAIHPFQDGNGRLSRILTTLLLLRFGYAYTPFASLERVVEENKAAYYSALRETQLSLRSDSPNWNPWIVFFLRSLVRQKNNLENRIDLEEGVLSDLSGISLQIATLLETQLSITVAGVVAATGANRNTVKSALRGLLRRGWVVQKGKGRGVYYTRLP
jgi:Fic family protein